MAKSTIIALGSNLGDQEKNLRVAAAELARLSEVPLLTSSIWWTTPEGFDETVSKFCNAVVRAEVELEAEELLAQLKAIERHLGRERRCESGYSSRVIDLDIIDFDSEISKSSDLELPHPRAWCRRFVLMPLQEVAPEFRFPDREQGLGALIDDAPENPMVRTIPLIPWV